MRIRSLLRFATALFAAFGMYLVLLCNPEPLFAYSLHEGTIVLHAPQPLSERARKIAHDADARLARSPLYDASASYHVYLNDTALRFAVFSTYRRSAGGVAYGGLTQNVFLRPSSIERDRLIRANGSEVPAERTLTYFIAHEVVHAMLTTRFGRIRYLQLPTWQNEGYADYVAKAGAFDYAKELQRYHKGDRELDPAKSRLYLRYQLMVSYWLEKRGLSVEQLFALPEAATGIDVPER